MWQGVFPAVTTKFDEGGTLDHREMARCFALQIEAGVDGLIVTGSLGENQTLERDEKLAVLQTALDVAGGRVPVLATIAESATHAACRQAAASAEAGAAGLMVLPGLPYKSDRAETLAHYRAVARAGGLPVMIYNNPVAYGVDLTPEMLEELAADDLFVAVKESSDDVRRVIDIANLLGDRYALFTGVDNLALESLAVGAVGWVAGLVCAFPRETVAVYRLARQGRFAEALAIYRWFRPLLDLDVSTRLVQNIKLAEALAIGSNDRVRPPRLPLSGAERERVTTIVEKALASRPTLPDLADAA